jgi:hypothetical protein
MPCDAIATATAKVSNEELMKQVDMETLKEVLIEHLRQKGMILTAAHHSAQMVNLEAGSAALSVDRSGAISLRRYGRRGRSGQESRDEQALADEIKAVVLETAGVLFQARMIATIGAMVPVLGQEIVPTEIGEAALMTVMLNGILSRIILLPNGEISVYTDEGAFADGVGGITTLFDSLAAVATFDAVSEPERHRHDGTEKAHHNSQARRHTHEQDGRSYRH